MCRPEIKIRKVTGTCLSFYISVLCSEKHEAYFSFSFGSAAITGLMVLPSIQTLLCLEALFLRGIALEYADKLWKIIL